MTNLEECINRANAEHNINEALSKFKGHKWKDVKYMKCYDCIDYKGCSGYKPRGEK